MEESLTEVEKLTLEAFRCIDSDMLTDAIGCFDKIIELEPNNDKVWTHKGKTMSMMAVNSREGGSRSITAIERTSNDQKRLLKEALKCFKKAIDINPKSDYAFQNQALTLGRLGRKDQALESNNTATELNPNNFEAWIQGTAWLMNLKRAEEAYEVCKRVKQLSGLDMVDDSLKIGFFVNFASALVELERYEEALVEINRAIDLDDKSPLPWVKKGDILFCLHMTGYLECFDNAIALEPDNKLWKELKSDYL